MNIQKVLHEPFFRHFRPRRMRRLTELFDIDDNTRIIDIGGVPDNWRLIDEQPQLTIVNIDQRHPRVEGRVKYEHGDGRALRHPDGSYDIAFSNSVIEHVGTVQDQAAFASEVARVGNGYFVQTPNRWFFVEPHVVAPFVHFLPKRIQRHVLRWATPWGLMTKPSQQYIDDFLANTRLVTYREMRRFFPDAAIVRERWLGMTKSLIAVRPQTGQRLEGATE